MLGLSSGLPPQTLSRYVCCASMTGLCCLLSPDGHVSRSLRSAETSGNDPLGMDSLELLSLMLSRGRVILASGMDPWFEGSRLQLLDVQMSFCRSGP